MKTTVDRFGWGLMLIVAGGVFMARNLGYQIDLTPAAGMVVASGLSVLSFIRYFAGDRQRWGSFSLSDTMMNVVKLGHTEYRNFSHSERVHSQEIARSEPYSTSSTVS